MNGELRSTINLVLGTGVTAGLSLAYAALTARVLGSERFSEVAACLALVMAAQTALGPINGVVARFTAAFVGRGEWGKVLTLHRSVRRRVVWWCLIGGGVAAIGSGWLAGMLRLTSQTPVLISFGIVFATLVLSVDRGVLRGAQVFTAHNVNTVLEAAVRLGAGAMVLWCWPQVGPALFVYLLALVITLAYSPRQLSPLWGHRSPEAVDMVEVRRFTAPMFAVMLINAGFQNVDMLYVKHALAAGMAGEYGAAFTVARLMAVIVTPFNVVLLPLLTAKHSAGIGITASLIRQCLYFLALTVGPLVLFIGWPEEVMHLIYGSGYAAGGEVLGELALVRILGHLCQMVALGGAAINDFRFLYIYAPGLAAQCLLLPMSGNAIGDIVRLLLWVHGVMVAAFAVYVVGRARGSRGKQVAPP